MGTTIKDLQARLDSTTRAQDAANPPSTSNLATVLVDLLNTDATLLIAPNRPPVVKTDHLCHPKIKSELATQLVKIKKAQDNSKEELWMYFDSDASRFVISTTSPIHTHLQAVQPTYESCAIGDGTPLQYIEKGNVMDNLEITVVQALKYDLFSFFLYSLSTS